MKAFKIADNEILKSTAEALTVSAYNDGSAVNISSANCVLYNNAGEQKYSGICSTSTNTATVTIADDLFTDSTLDNKAVFTLEIGTGTYVYAVLFNVVSQKIYNSVIATDLEAEIPNLDDDEFPNVDEWSGFIDRAFEYVKVDLKKKIKEPSYIIDAEQVKYLTINKTFHLIYTSLMRNPDDYFAGMAETYLGRYRELLDSTVIRYDNNNDGFVDTDFTATQVKLLR